MGFTLSELDAVAQGVLAVVALVSLLAPLVSLINDTLKDFHFKRPGLFCSIASVASLGTLLSVLVYRNSLHRFLPFWLLLILFVIAVLVLWSVEVRYRQSAQDSAQATRWAQLGFLVYVLAASLLAAGVTKWSAEYIIFRQVKGRVTSPSSGQASVGITVYIANQSTALESVTNSKGRYRFLLTEANARRFGVIRAGINRSKDRNYHNIDWPETSQPYLADLEWER